MPFPIPRRPHGPRPIRRWAVLLIAAALAATGPSAGAEGADAEPPPESTMRPDPYVFGFDTEPAMEIASDTVATIQDGTWDLFALSNSINEKGWTRPVIQAPIGLLMVLVQHEVLGHGSRAREFGLDPSYGLGDEPFSAWTQIDKIPQGNAEITLIAAGGVESTTVQSGRLLDGLVREGGGAGSGVPFLFFAKLDLSLYVLSTSDPEPPSGGSDDFQRQYEEGNDIAMYLVSRQGDRVDAPPADVWDRTYQIDYDDPLLQDNWDQVRIAAAWNLLDGAVVSSVVGYFKQHVSKRQFNVTPPVWRPRPGLGITFGTRGLLADNAVSRVLDAYFILPQGTVSAYVRDIDSSVDRTWGVGVGYHDIRLGPVRLGFQADWWDEPFSLEGERSGRAWNVGTEISWMFHRHWGVRVRGGMKTEGYLPGLRIDDGGYGGFGLLVQY